MRLKWIIGVVTVFALVGGCALNEKCQYAFGFKTKCKKDEPEYKVSILEDGRRLCADAEPREGFYCVRVFYGTTRSLDNADKLLFGESFNNSLALGFSDVSVPLMKSRFFSEVDDPDFHPLFNKSEPLRQRNEIAERVAIRTLSSNHLDQGKKLELEAEVFTTDLNKYLQLSDQSILLYVHGMNQSFEVALAGAAQLAVDLTYNDDRPLDTYIDPEKLFGKGYPVLFSWPNRIVDEPHCAWWDRWCAWVDAPSLAAETYTREVSLAARSSERLAEFLEIVVDNTETTEINIVMHSMGNRVFMEALPYLEERLRDDERFSNINIRIVHAASEYGYLEHWRALAWLKEQNTGFFEHLFAATTIYTAETDGALFYGELNRLIEKVGSYYSDLFSLDLSSLGPERIYSDVADVCRVGLWSAEWLSLEGKCLFPFTVYGGNEDEFSTVDATGFDLKYDDKGFKDYGHDYFINSPAILSDMSCAFDNRRSPELGKRALIDKTDRGDPRYWSFDPNAGSDPTCKILEWREPTNPLGIEYISNFSTWFGLSIEQANDLRNQMYEWSRRRMAGMANASSKPSLSYAYSGLDFVSCDTVAPPFVIQQDRIILFFDLWSSEIKPSAREALTNFYVDRRAERLSVLAFADRSGDERTNDALAKERAEAVARLLVELGMPKGNISLEVGGEAVGEFDLSDEKRDDYRCAMNRRAEVVILE